MPKGKSIADSRISDLVVLAKDERAKAIRMLTALNETINRETEALATG